MNTNDNLGPMETWRSCCEQLAGPLIETLLESESATERCLTHPELKVRLAARLVRRHYWRKTPTRRERACRFCERVAGPASEVMLKSLEATKTCLAADEPKVRLAALVMLREYWITSLPSADLLESMMLLDPDPEVRQVALTSLCSYYAKSKNKRITKRLAHIVRDETKPRMFRFLAYRGLFIVHGRQYSSWPSLLSAITDLRFPEGVEWSFVESFLQ